MNNTYSDMFFMSCLKESINFYENIARTYTRSQYVHAGIRQTNYKRSYWIVFHPQKPNEVTGCIVSELDYICIHKKSLSENFYILIK